MQEVPFLSRCCNNNKKLQLFIFQNSPPTHSNLKAICYISFEVDSRVQTANCFFSSSTLNFLLLLPNHFLHYFIPQAHCHTQYFKKVYCSRGEFLFLFSNIPQKFPSTAATTNSQRHDDGDDDDEEEKNFFLFECHHQKFIVQKDVKRWRGGGR